MILTIYFWGEQKKSSQSKENIFFIFLLASVLSGLTQNHLQLDTGLLPKSVNDDLWCRFTSFRVEHKFFFYFIVSFFI